MEELIRERDVEAYLVRLLSARGGQCVKFVPDQMPGMPDRIAMLPGGALVWVETKRPRGGRVSPLQRFRHDQLRALGQRVELVLTKGEAAALVAELAGETEKPPPPKR